MMEMLLILKISRVTMTEGGDDDSSTSSDDDDSVKKSTWIATSGNTTIVAGTMHHSLQGFMAFVLPSLLTVSLTCEQLL